MTFRTLRAQALAAGEWDIVPGILLVCLIGLLVAAWGVACG